MSAITADEQLSHWVAGESIHRLGAPHGNLRPLDPPGAPNRRWRCECGAEGDPKALRAEPCPNGGECVPDFSCCVPGLLAPESVRRAFVAGDATTRERFMYTFLGAAIAHHGETTGKEPRVHIAGRGEGS